jgi:hypothetical protein
MICVPYVDSSVYEVQVLQALVPWALHTSNGKSNHCPEEQSLLFEASIKRNQWCT